MKINEKFFVPPSKDQSDFKELFRRLTAAGAGRPVDEEGFPTGPWTPELLADAISEIEANTNSVDLRTVQLWFQDNERGIHAANIRWLARIFGCNDPEATHDWQVELFAAHDRLVAKRKRKRLAENQTPPPARQAPSLAEPISIIESLQTKNLQEMGTRAPKWRFAPARFSDALFSNRSTLSLPALIWVGWIVLGFLAYIMGVHSVTYSPIDGLQKQVGFFWAPNWTLVELVILPQFLVTVGGLLAFWKRERQSLLTFAGTKLDEKDSWPSRVKSFAFSHWVVFFVCLVIVFLVQWSGVHMRALVNSDISNHMVDWNLMALVRPEVISIPEATIISFLAFLYTAVICFLFLTGLLMMYTLVEDFFEICSEPDHLSNRVLQNKIVAVSTKLLTNIYRASLLGIWIATCIKLQATYLLSDGQNIVDWLFGDVLFVLGHNDKASGWLGQRSLAHFTSFLLLSSTCLVFVFGFVQIYRVLERALPLDAVGRLAERQCVPRWTMLCVVGLLVANFFLVGQFSGFSILLIVGILTTVCSLYDPRFGRAQVSEMITSKS